jgi:hypothetical protein
MACTNIKIIGLGAKAFVDEENELRAKTVPSPEDVTWHLDLGVNPKISGAHGEILRTSWDSVGIKQLEVRCSGVQVFFEQHVLKRQPTSGPPLIITGSEVTPEARAFNPHATDRAVRNKGRVILSVHVLNIPEGGVRVRWTVAEEPTKGRTGMVRLLAVKEGTDEQPDEKPARTVEGRRVEVIGFDPGLTAVDVEVLNKADVVLASQKFQLMVPQFITVDNNLNFDAFLAGHGLTALKDRILGDARVICEVMLREVNVRLIWSNDPNDAVPAHLPDDLVTNAFIEDQLVTSQSFADIAPSAVAAFGEIKGLTMGRSGVASNATFDDIIGIFPGEFTNLQVVDLDLPVVALIGQALGGAPDLAGVAVGRLVGATLAHESLHALLGRVFPVTDDNPLGDHATLAGDILVEGNRQTFAGMTGIVIIDNEKFPAALTFTDFGSVKDFGDVIHKPLEGHGGSLDRVHEFFPVPPHFQ